MTLTLPTEIFDRAITEPSAWTPEELKADRHWETDLDQDQIDDLRSALDAARHLKLEEITAENFPLPHCGPVITSLQAELRSGRGMALMHGFPVTDHDRDEISRMYWGFCTHLGPGVTQNSDGGLIHYVTEGKLRPNQGTRGVGNPGLVSLHVDLADVVTLMCVRQAADSPRSQLVSSQTIHNVLRERAPEALARLYRGFAWDRQNEHGGDEGPTTDYRVPVFSQLSGIVSGRYNRNWITKAANRSGGLTAEDTALFDLIDEIAQEVSFAFDFQPGDVQFANNYVVWHGREAHTPAQDEDATRLLMRIWFNLADVRDFADEAVIRHGILRHGKLGWSAADVAAGLAGRIHPRRPADQAPLVENVL
jgi:hypothetical protein